jgi:hypothetical protein
MLSRLETTRLSSISIDNKIALVPHPPLLATDLHIPAMECKLSKAWLFFVDKGRRILHNRNPRALLKPGRFTPRSEGTKFCCPAESGVGCDETLRDLDARPSVLSSLEA